MVTFISGVGGGGADLEPVVSSGVNKLATNYTQTPKSQRMRSRN